MGQDKRKTLSSLIQTVKPFFGEHRGASHFSEIREVSLWYEPLRLSLPSQAVICFQFTFNPPHVGRDTGPELGEMVARIRRSGRRRFIC